MSATILNFIDGYSCRSRNSRTSTVFRPRWALTDEAYHDDVGIGQEPIDSSFRLKHVEDTIRQP